MEKVIRYMKAMGIGLLTGVISIVCAFIPVVNVEIASGFYKGMEEGKEV